MPDSPLSGKDKKFLRKLALTHRQTLPVEAINHAVCAHLVAWPLFLEARHILFYFPVRNEIDLRPLCHIAPEKAWYLPAVLSSQDMMFRRVQADFNLKPGIYGISEPPEYAEPWDVSSGQTVLLTPGLLFDASGYRLGYGKGYYDRFLSLPTIRKHDIPKVGIVAHELIHDELPHDAWDIPMDFLCSEHGICPTNGKSPK